MTQETDAFLQALSDLDHALTESEDVTSRMRERISHVRAELATGHTLREIVSSEEPPVLVQYLTQGAQLLHTYGTRVRRTEARALHKEGMTMDEIARLFGVTRQRVSALLRDSSSDATA